MATTNTATFYPSCPFDALDFTQEFLSAKMGVITGCIKIDDREIDIAFLSPNVALVTLRAGYWGSDGVPVHVIPFVNPQEEIVAFLKQWLSLDTVTIGVPAMTHGEVRMAINDLLDGITG